MPSEDPPAVVRSQQGAGFTAVAECFLGGCGSGRRCLWGSVFVYAPAAVAGCEGWRCRWQPLWMPEGHRCAAGPKGICAGRGKGGQESNRFNVMRVIHEKHTFSWEKCSVFKVLGRSVGLLKLKGREEQKHEGSGEADEDQKMRRVTSAAGFGLCNTGNQEL